MGRRIKVSVLLGLGVLLFFQSCMTVSSFTVDRPGELNLRNVPVIAVGPVDAENVRHAVDVAETFSTVLVKSSYFSSVLDRQNLDKLMQEQKLGMSGLVDDATVVRIGKLSGASVLVLGRISTDSYREQTEVQKIKRYNMKDKVDEEILLRTRKGTYSLTVNVRVVEAETARILGNKVFNLEKGESTQAENEEPAAIDSNALYQTLIDDLSRRFEALMVPHKEVVFIQYQNDQELPEVDKATAFMNAGDIWSALDIFKEAAAKVFKDPKARAKALYNWGITLVYAGEIGQALASLNQALSLVPGESLYIEALVTAREEKKRLDRLAEQLK